jgi:hypothetical protein
MSAPSRWKISDKDPSFLVTALIPFTFQLTILDTMKNCCEKMKRFWNCLLGLKTVKSLFQITVKIAVPNSGSEFAEPKELVHQVRNSNFVILGRRLIFCTIRRNSLEAWHQTWLNPLDLQKQVILIS